MDIKMPVMDGIEANQHIKSYNPHIPVIAITAYAQAGDKVRFLQNNLDNYISKPVNAKQLIDMLSYYASKILG